MHRIPHNRWHPRPEYLTAAQRVISSGHVGPGPEVEALERELAERFRRGDDCAVVSSGTAALYLAIRVLGLARVRMSTYNCTALLHAAQMAGADVELCDIDPDSLNASRPVSLSVDTYGMPAATGTVHDFTWSPGANYRERTTGSLGDASVISFAATKPLGVGMGGAVLGSKELIAEIRDIRDYDGKRSLRPRFNFSLGDVSAAMVRCRLSLLNEENEWRFEVATRYGQFSKLGQNGRYVFLVHPDELSIARGHFESLGIEVINPLEPWELLHNQLWLDPTRFPTAERASRETLSLPIWVGMTEEEVSRVCRALETLEV